LSEGITFSTQNQIDSFQYNYPGCNQIEGYVIIKDDNIKNLNGLIILTSIGEYLQIVDGDSLTSLSGLDSLTIIGEDLWIETDGLTSLKGLGNLTSIGSNLIIRLTHSLVSLSGIDNLDSIGGSLWIYHNNDLTSISGLNSLSSINGGLSIIFNNYLQSLDGLGNIYPASIQALSIHDNPLLSDCEVQSICDYLVSPNGVVNIYKNGYGCQSPAEIANSCGNTMSCLPFGNYYFCNQTEINNFQANYPGCTELMGDVTIEGYNITNLDSLIVLTSVEGNLNMACIDLAGFPCNPSLYSIAGLANLTSIGGNLDLQGNTSLTSLEGLEGLDSIGGSLWIEWNPSLSTLEGLNNLNYINGSFGLGSGYPPNSNVLTSLAGLENLTYIGGGLSIFGNPYLVNLQGLENVTSIGDYLSIQSNDTLISLSGLDNVTSIGGDLQIRFNNALTSLSGLAYIDANSINDLEITLNSILSTCEVESICDYLVNPNGTIRIHDNATGCNSVDEVEEACVTLSVGDIETHDHLTIYPNPFTGETTFNISLNEPSQVNLVVIDRLGKPVATVLDKSLAQGSHNITWNAEGMSAGLYFYRLTPGNHSSTGKLVVVR
jgi:hypothetical protein